jgi:hypothetical protein
LTEFLHVMFGFPTALFSFLLIVVVGYWVAVLVGAASADILDADADVDTGDAAEVGGVAGWLAGAGLGGAPVTVVVSLLVAVAWFASLAGAVLIGRMRLATPVSVAASVAVLLLALGLAWLATRLLMLPLRRLAPAAPAPSRADFVGRTCVVRTGRVGLDFGQAEVTAADGSTAVIQVRQTGADSFRAGTSALIYDYDTAGEFFWVVPVDACNDQSGSARLAPRHDPDQSP